MLYYTVVTQGNFQFHKSMPGNFKFHKFMQVTFNFNKLMLKSFLFAQCYTMKLSIFTKLC